MGTGGSISMSNLPNIGRDRKKDEFINKLLTVDNKLLSKPLHEIMPSGLWKGRRAFIVGGGTSLRNFDFSQLKGELVIAVNRAMEFCPNAAIMFSQDARLFGWYDSGDLGIEAKKKFEEFKGFRTWLNTPNFPFPEDIYTIPCTNIRDFNWTKYNYANGLPFCSSSGLSALCLAICLGADPIYLLGFDLYGENGKSANFHAGYPSHNDDKLYKDSMLPNFEQFAPAIKKMARVINLNPKSQLPFFEFGNIEGIPKKNKMPLFIGFYTKDTGYEEEIKNLEKSLVRFGLEYYFEGLENMKDWRKNVHLKMDFILRCMEKFPGRDLVQMDSDCIVMQYPELFAEINKEYDVAYYAMPEQRYIQKGQEYVVKNLANVSVLYLRNTEKVRRLIEEWQKKDATLEDHIDDLSFTRVMLMRSDIKMFQLPRVYCHIFDQETKEEPVIELFQASRRLRKDINDGKALKKNIIYVSMFTKNTPYEDEAKILIDSFRKFGLRNEVIGIDHQGSFEANCRMKPTILLKVMEDNPGSNIVWVDADASIEAKPVLFETIQEDISVYYINWDIRYGTRKGLQLCTGTVFLQNNDRVKNLLRLWVSANEKAIGHDTDQEVLQRLLDTIKGTISIFPLPKEYVVIPNITDSDSVIIRHRQASRKYRAAMGEDKKDVQFVEKKIYTALWAEDYTPSKCAEPIARMIVNRMNGCKSLIDLGCGNGLTVGILRKLGYDCKGADITGAGMRGNLQEWFTEACVWVMPFQSKEFDFTFSTDMLEHLPTDKVDDAIKEILRITKIKTFHCIATFTDKRMVGSEEVVLHKTVRPVGWWQQKFREFNAGRIDVEIIDRVELLGLVKMGAVA